MNCDILYQFIAVSLICHVTWARIETLLQGDYTREEVFNPVAYSNNFLGVCSLKENAEHGVLSEPRC